MCPVFIAVEFEEDQVRLLEAGSMASSCQETVVDSGVDSEATTPSSPEDGDPREDSDKPKELSNDEMVLETAETLLALSGKKSSSLISKGKRNSSQNW